MAKVAAMEGLTPKAMDICVAEGGINENSSNDVIHLKEHLTLMNGIVIIVGLILGWGIFVSPTLALKYSGSKNMVFIIWVLSGILSMIGALCYAELVTMIPKPGGDYAYIGEAFGSLPSFLYLWVAIFILMPTGNAITALAFAQNILKPFWPQCEPPGHAVSLIAAVVTCFVTTINCYNVKWVTRLQDSFTAANIFTLVLAFFISLWYTFSGHTENLESMMTGNKTLPSALAIAFYTGLFSYSGWNYLNFVTEELKVPYKNLPRAICVSMPVVTLVYVLTNVAYFAVITNVEISASEAVTVTFSEKFLGMVIWIMPLFVALCILGSLNGAINASSRLFFVGARNGHLPMAISSIDIKRMTPVPSLIFMCLVTLVLLIINNVEFLIVEVAVVEAIFTLCSVTGLLWLRYTRPALMRPIRVHLSIPISYIIICILFIVLCCSKYQVEVGIGLAFIILGVLVYIVFIKWQNKPIWLLSACDSFNILCFKTFICLPEDSKNIHRCNFL